MLTAILQVAVAVITLAFAGVALAVRRGGGHATEERRAAWLLVGAAFLLAGANNLVANSVALWGVWAGDGTLAMEAALRGRVVGNSGRALMMLGFAAGLAHRLAARRPLDVSSPGRALRPLLLWMLAGTLLGALEAARPLAELERAEAGRHYQLIAVIGAAAVLLLLVALWLAVTRDRMDWLLWTALLVYTVREVVSVSLLSVFAWLNVPRVWMPSYRSFQELALGAYLVMVACAAWRLRLGRRRASVPSLFELGGDARPAPPRE